MKKLLISLVAMMAMGCNGEAQITPSIGTINADTNKWVRNTKSIKALKLLDTQIMYSDSAMYFVNKMMYTKSDDSISYYSNKAHDCLHKSKQYHYKLMKSLTPKQH